MIMDNKKMPPVQQPNMSYTPPAPEQAAATVLMDQRNKASDFIKTVLAVAFGIMSLVFLGLFVYFMTQYNILQECGSS